MGAWTFPLASRRRGVERHAGDDAGVSRRVWFALTELGPLFCRSGLVPGGQNSKMAAKFIVRAVGHQQKCRGAQGKWAEGSPAAPFPHWVGGLERTVFESCGRVVLEGPQPRVVKPSLCGALLLSPQRRLGPDTRDHKQPWPSRARKQLDNIKNIIQKETRVTTHPWSVVADSTRRLLPM